ncbi:GumC family protein [Flavobacterium succinicans]|uniref:Putative tyrosine-protein kinase in cps region n=1 Tax=Flavobacterium succinicans TaxID=29536 RepID=A0A199XQU5_9FLAO|nr:Wzz/FepE/Etk N-terminal domain-containing protein [Flavobacterium succinicans]OAZ04020.1 putative tyrosine-protein kinase in cps region [Flavobacterium succinicans]
MNENIRLLKPLFRGMPIIILSVVLSIMAAKKYLNYVTPMYESTARLKLADIQEGLSNSNLFKDMDALLSSSKIAAEIEVLKSSALIEKTISKLPFNKEIYRKGGMLSTELFENSPILIDGSFEDSKALDKRYGLQLLSKKEFLFFYPESKEGINGQIGKPLVIEGGKIVVRINEDYIATKKEIKVIDKYEFEFLSQQKLLDKINSNLDIVPVEKDVPVIRINFKSNVPLKAALFVNKLAEVYIKDYIESKYKAANTTVNFLKGEIQTSNQKLKASEDNIQNYRDQNNIINIRQETETDLRKIAQQKIEQTNLKMSLDAIKNLNQYIAKGKDNYLELSLNFEAFTDLLSTELVKKMKQLQAEKKDLLLTYTPNHEKVKIIDEKLKDLIDYQIESIKNTEKNLQIKYNNLKNDIKESEKVFIGLPEKEKQLNSMSREFNLYEKNYNFLNEKRIDAEIAQSAKIAFHKIITAGEVSKNPVSPIRIIIIIVAAAIGLLGSIIIIYIVHFLKAKVNDSITIEKSSSIPIALTTPYLKTTESINNNFLKEALQLEIKGIIPPKSILVVSSYDDANQHLFHSENLIKAFQNQGRKTLIIDATGQLNNKFEATHYVDYSDDKYHRYTQEHFQNDINAKMSTYDLVLIHNQALKDAPLALLFMSLATQNLVVLDSRETAEKRITTINLLKEEFQLPNVWFVLNKTGYNPNLFVEAKKMWKKYRKN